MKSYLFKRLLYAVPTLLGISLICFCLVQLSPGGPVEQLLAEWRHSSLGESGDKTSQVTEEQRQALVEYFGFNEPLLIRYAKWMGKVLTLDLGESYHYGESVASLIGRALPISLSLGFFSFFIVYLISIPLGISKAVRHGSKFDATSSTILFLLYSIPSFALGVLLIVFFAGGSFYSWFPAQGLFSDNWDDLTLVGKVADYFLHLTLPLFCSVIGALASVTLMMKNSLLDQLKQDYILTARAKGLRENAVIWRHAVRNALLPIASGMGQWLSVFFSGSVLLETVFGLQGMGRLSYESILRRDYPIVLANIIILSVLHIAGNLLSDLAYVALDPRIDFT